MTFFHDGVILDCTMILAISEYMMNVSVLIYSVYKSTRTVDLNLVLPV